MRHNKKERFTRIPNEVLVDPNLRLKPTAKLLYGIIYGLAINGKSLEGYCFGGDKNLASYIDASYKSVERALIILEEAGHIKIDQKDGYRTRKIYPLTGLIPAPEF
jgi:hypothetical protein